MSYSGIYSYLVQGVGKSGVVKSEHCMVFSDPGRGPPALLEDEHPQGNEAGMQSLPILIERTDGFSMHLQNATRLNLGKEFSPLEYERLRVKDYGMVNPSYMQALLQQWLIVQANMKLQ